MIRASIKVYMEYKKFVCVCLFCQCMVRLEENGEGEGEGLERRKFRKKKTLEDRKSIGRWNLPLSLLYPSGGRMLGSIALRYLRTISSLNSLSLLLLLICLAETANCI